MAKHQVTPKREDVAARGTTRARARGRMLAIVAVAASAMLIAAGCGSDDPLSAEGGTNLCTLESPSGATLDVDADHDEGEAEADHDEGEAEADHEESPALTTADADWVVDIEMNEFSYLCDLPAIEAGATVALQFTNVGVVEHEAVVGDLAAQNEAEAVMAEADADHAVGHDRPSITLQPGESGTLVVDFPEAGSLILGCHIPGHWDAGMRSDFVVQ